MTSMAILARPSDEEVAGPRTLVSASSSLRFSEDVSPIATRQRAGRYATSMLPPLKSNVSFGASCHASLMVTPRLGALRTAHVTRDHHEPCRFQTADLRHGNKP